MSEAVLDSGTQAAIDIDQSKGDFSYPESHKYDAGCCGSNCKKDNSKY